MDWGIALGFLCLLLLQVAFAIASVFAFFALKTQAQRLTDAHQEYTRRAEVLESSHEQNSKKYEKFIAKFEATQDVISDLKARKIDTLEDVEKNLRTEIKRVGARVSYLHGVIKDGPAEEEKEEELPPGAMYAPEQQPNPPARPEPAQNEVQGDFGKVA